MGLISGVVELVNTIGEIKWKLCVESYSGGDRVGKYYDRKVCVCVILKIENLFDALRSDDFFEMSSIGTCSETCLDISQ